MILVTGATGLVGSHLVCVLLENRQKVRALYRNKGRIEAFEAVARYYPKAKANEQLLEWFEADLLDLTSLKRACKNIDLVYHTAAYISFDPAKRNLLRKVNIEGTANLVNMALAQGIKQLCHVSSVATLGDSINGKAVTEQTEWNPQNPGSGYAISKYGAEMEVWRGSQEGLEVSMVLPGVILGEGSWDSASGSLIPRAAKGMPFYTPGGSGFVDVKDVVRALIKVANTPKAQGQKYVLVGVNAHYKELFELVAKNTGGKAPKRKVAKWVMRCIAVLDGLKAKVSGQPRELTQNLVDSLYKMEPFSSEKIKEELEFEFTPLEQTVERICQAFNESNP